MTALRLAFRTLQFFVGTALFAWILCIPVIGLACLVSWKVAFVFLVLLAVIAPLALLLISEHEIPTLLGAGVSKNPGFRNSYEMAYSVSGVELVRLPALLTYPDPTPNVLVIRSIGKDGAILLSEGLVALLEEDEIRAILARGIRHLVSSAILLQSACILALLLIRRKLVTDAISPGSALSKPLTAAEAAKNLLFFPWLRFYGGLAEGAGASVGADDAVALPKLRGHLSRAERLYGQQSALHGLVYLGIER